jgi:hypothetical protein
LENIARRRFILGSHLTLQAQVFIALNLSEMFGCQ